MFCLLEVRSVALYQKADDEAEESQDGAEDFNDEDLDEANMGQMSANREREISGLTEQGPQRLPAPHCCR